MLSLNGGSVEHCTPNTNVTVPTKLPLYKVDPALYLKKNNQLGRKKMTTFLNALENELNTTTTVNGAKAYKSTGSRCLDLFGKIAACRNDVAQAMKLFSLAFAEDPETATRILFWARDIRGGQGERKIFRELFQELVRSDATIGAKLVSLIPEYGRWDDLLSLENTLVWDTALNMIKAQLTADLNTEVENPVSLVAKWLPSVNASSKNSRRLGRKIAATMGWNAREYRKALAALRTRIRIVEQAMCAREWERIDYSKLPSRAGFMYRKAFAKRDGDRYQAYLNSVEKGEAKINAGTLYPYEIVDKYLTGRETNDQTLNLMWEALPNYMDGQEFNGLVVADVSGSMRGTPMAVSISLAMYISERNTGIWKDKFLTFSSCPELQTVTGATIASRIRNLSQAAWQMNTDLQAVFNLVLNTAVKNSVPESDMPRKLIIVSDMQFDRCCSGASVTNFEAIRIKYAQAGYSMPELVFWNVNSYENVPMKMHDTGTCLVSGCSPSTLKSLLTGKVVTPIDTMKDTVYTERYDAIGSVFSN